MTFPAQNSDARKQAREWVALVTSGDATERDLELLEEWRGANADNEAAYRDVEALWNEIGGTESLRALIPADVVVPNRTRSRFNMKNVRFGVVSGITAMAAAASMLFLYSGNIVETPVEPAPSAPLEFETQIAEIREITLEDGSTVTIGADSEIETSFTSEERRVALISGEAFFSVAKDENRPFLVTVGDSVVRVVGTKFDVRRGTNEVSVSVVEGVVEVRRQDRRLPGDTMTELATLTAGQKITVEKNVSTVAVESVGAAPQAAWRSGRLIYQDADLREVIADANRYFDGTIILASDDLGDLGVTAGFRTDQIDQLINGVAAVLDLNVDRDVENVVILSQTELE